MRTTLTGWADTVLMNDGGAGGDGGGGAAGGEGTGENGAATAAAAAATAAAGGQSSSAAPDGTTAAGTPYRPEGLPDHLFGANDQETIDRLNKAVSGFRQAQGDVPDTAEAYKEFAQVDDTIKPFMETLTGDKLFDGMTAYAKEAGIPKAQFQGLVTKLMGLGVETGMFEPPIDVGKERELLTPANARHLPEAEQKTARDKRMNENFAFLDQVVTKDGGNDGGLSKEAVDYAKMMLGDRAVGHEFFEFLRSKTGGGGTGPLLPANGGTNAGNDARAELARRAGLPENTWGNRAFNQASYDKLQADYEALIPDPK